MNTMLENRYQILQELGDGGFGKTFIAEDTHIPSRRRSVIKQLKPINESSQVYQLVKQRFQREAAVLEALGNNSQQIPTLYAYFESGGQFYLVQEYIEGDTLARRLQTQGVEGESTVGNIVVNILQILNYVHSQGIVHRDIKPENIILRRLDDLPVLIDFGAVKETMQTTVSQGGSTGKSSIVIGTPGFMPAEQTAGRPVFASDLYALALTAIYLMTGKIPQDLTTDPYTGELAWQEFAPGVSPDFAAVINKAIQSHPRERYRTAKEMLDALPSSNL
ncbi:MAG: serine/threonine protein kinase, partial [Prochloron sp. SP5CPC1]|nr:serine/threonine protein kinase [Candidatus Paraprochloron terpiosi SP5CPC1]